MIRDQKKISDQLKAYFLQKSHDDGSGDGYISLIFKSLLFYRNNIIINPLVLFVTQFCFWCHSIHDAYPFYRVV